MKLLIWTIKCLSQTKNFANIKKPHIDLSSDTNFDDLSKNVFENFNNIENDNFKQIDVPLHEHLNNLGMKAFRNLLKMKIIKCQVCPET